MAKKYVPSGYQIINIQIPDLFTECETYTRDDHPEFEELFKIVEQPISKPVLLTVTDSDGNIVSGLLNLYKSNDTTMNTFALIEDCGAGYIDVIKISIDLTANEILFGQYEISEGE